MTLFNWRRSGLVLTLAALAATAAAQDKAAIKPDAAKGQQIAANVCAGCHGADGNSVIPANPVLAQQFPHYLVKQLVDYTVRPGDKKPARENAIMNGIASTLSAQDRADVSAWFYSQAAKPGTARSKDQLELAQKIWRAGIIERSVPACAGCHGPAGSGVPIQYPRLSGQHAEYVEATLKAFRDGTRHNNVPMQQIAAKLTDAEMRALADFIQGLRR
jgi:cytochrome c553